MIYYIHIHIFHAYVQGRRNRGAGGGARAVCHEKEQNLSECHISLRKCALGQTL